ncbi:hypothetical protein O53_1690 [Microcystis aeruginosa TAIHU98]|uniref:Uncharacterized protein n=2 Tax=Microcystis aeruginosa TaxID=1126 RepID=L7EEH1_MICAE|nr:hypothetical protein BH695_1223 [Microcystis aeruginosa PCC 7806SL]ELP57078.1 hypothetical protein O53_1690 [Microcystis aeruginosa TAIHU98]
MTMVRNQYWLWQNAPKNRYFSAFLRAEKEEILSPIRFA